MLRIAHISDIHIRNFKYHAEYRETFENLYAQFRELKPDLIVNTGDTVHSKLQISPELVQMVAEHFERVSAIAPYVVMLGNHDLNLHNLGRVDAISPIATQFENVHLLKKSRPVTSSDLFLGAKNRFVLWPFSMADSENYPKWEDRQGEFWPNQQHVNIGLFHGSVAGCVTDSEWTMADAETDLSLFAGLDYVLMGDIHKQQFFKDRRIAYAGSLIQQNFGESHDKGFLFWEIESSSAFNVKHVPVQSPLKFRTLRATDDLVVPVDQTTSRGAYVRVFVPRAITPSEQKALIADVKGQFQAKDVICVLSPEAQDVKDRPVMAVDDGDVLNARDLATQERLLRQFLDDREIDEETTQRIVDLNRQVQSEISDEDVARNVRWNISKIGWSNLFGYGEGNIIDFSRIPGTTGIFGPNGTGKSSIFDIISEGLFDKVTKDVSKNVELINDNREEAKVVCHLTVDHRDYIIERGISRIKYGQRKKDVKEWGRTDVDFYVVEGGERTSLNGQSRPETEKAIRKVLGSFDDFCLTSFSPQNSIVGLPGGGDIISCKETDRKKILFRVLDLDVFEKKSQAVKDQVKAEAGVLRSLSRDDLVEEIEGYRKRLAVQIPSRVTEWREELESNQVTLESTLLLRQDLQRMHDSITVSTRRQARPVATIDSELAARAVTMEKILAQEASIGQPPTWTESEPVDVTDELRSVEAKVAALSQTNEILREKEKDGRWKLRVLEEVPCGEQFPSCKFLIDAFHAKQAIPTVMKERAGVEDLLSSYGERADSLRERHRTWERFQAHRRAVLRHGESLLEISRKKEKVAQETATLTKERATALEIAGDDDAVKRKAALAAQITKADGLLKSLRNEVARCQDELQKAVSARENAVMLLENAEEQLEALDRRLSDLRVKELYVEAFGKNGIPRIVLAQALPLINSEINRILAGAVDFTVSLEHDESDQSVGLYLQYGQYRRRNIALSGGAQKFIASLAIRAAIVGVTSLPRTNMFIIDEGFGKLDPSMLDSVQRMLDYLKTRFDHVLLVSHLDGMRDFIDNVIEIGSDTERYAHVEVA